MVTLPFADHAQQKLTLIDENEIQLPASLWDGVLGLHEAFVSPSPEKRNPVPRRLGKKKNIKTKQKHRKRSQNKQPGEWSSEWVVTLATSDMLSQAPPTREYFPSPILDKMTDDESSGPTANGVCLTANNTFVT